MLHAFMRTSANNFKHFINSIIFYGFRWLLFMFSCNVFIKFELISINSRNFLISRSIRLPQSSRLWMVFIPYKIINILPVFVLGNYIKQFAAINIIEWMAVSYILSLLISNRNYTYKLCTVIVNSVHDEIRKSHLK